MDDLRSRLALFFDSVHDEDVLVGAVDEEIGQRVHFFLLVLLGLKVEAVVASDMQQLSGVFASALVDGLADLLEEGLLAHHQLVVTLAV